MARFVRGDSVETGHWGQRIAGVVLQPADARGWVLIRTGYGATMNVKEDELRPALSYAKVRKNGRDKRQLMATVHHRRYNEGPSPRANPRDKYSDDHSKLTTAQLVSLVNEGDYEARYELSRRGRDQYGRKTGKPRAGPSVGNSAAGMRAAYGPELLAGAPRLQTYEIHGAGGARVGAGRWNLDQIVRTVEAVTDDPENAAYWGDELRGLGVGESTVAPGIRGWKRITRINGGWPIVVGARVQFKGTGYVGTVTYIDGREAWVRLRHGTARVAVSKLRRIA